jgi:phage terminase small subunit
LYSKAMWKGEEVEIATGVGMDGKVRVQGFIHDQRVPVEELQSIQSEVAAPPAAPAVANPLPSPEPIPEKPVGAKSAQTRQRNKAGGVQSPTSAPKSVFESLDDIDAAVAAKKITPAQAVKARNALLKKSGQKPPEEPPTPGITSMGGLAPSDPTEPAGKGLPSVEELLAGGGGTATRPATPTTAQGFMASMRDAFSGQRFSQAFKGWLGGMAGETMPKTTVQDRLSGELGARFLSSPIAARHVAEVFAGDVLGADVDPNQFGAALSEDNLRSIKAGLPPEEAENVFSFIGKEDSPFATEKEYQAYLQQPEVKAAIARHKENWTNIVEPMYREAMKIDPDEELPSRGQQTGARVNLNANPDEKTDIVTTQPRGNLMGTLTKKSPFGRKAYGSGKNYGMNYTDLMHQTFTRQLEIANKNAFEAQLVKSGNAKIAKPGLRDLTLGDGSATKEVPLKRQTIIKDGKPIPVNRSLYIRQNLASEYLTAANVHPNQFAEKINGALNKFINTSALAGLTDASVHVSNLSSALLTRPGPGNIIRDSLLSLFGRADIPLTIARTLRKAVADNSTQTAALAEMGALKGGSPSKGRLLGRVSNFIQRADKTVRLSLDDVYKSLVAQGLQENTETTRREFVNQVGQYSKRAQGPFVRFLRDSGFGPFVTAGRTFNTLGFRMATLNPGGKATSPSAAAIMRLNLASKWIGTAVFIGGLNYLFTGKPGGRPGTPIGTVDTGKDTDEGKPITVPVARMFGLDRAMRVTGLKGFANAKALGLDTTTALDSAGRDVFNAAISPAAGPPVRLGVGAATGYSPAVRVGRQFPVVAPGQSQFVSDAKNALLEANPIAGTIHAAMQPNANVLDAARRSFPSFAPQAGKAPDMVANYPRIVSRAQLNDYITDVAKRARGMSSEARSEYLKQSADSVPDDLKKDFWAQMKRRKVQ